MESSGKLKLITRGLDDVSGAEELEDLLREGNSPNILWSVIINDKPHFGHFIPVFKVADFVQAGCKVTVLFADLNGYMDGAKSEWDLMNARCQWYEFVIKEMLSHIRVPIDKIHFVHGNDYQLTEKFTLDMYKLSALVTTEATLKAGGEESTKPGSNPLLSSQVFPILNALDEEYNHADIHMGACDLKDLHQFARDKLPIIGYKKRVQLFHKILPSLSKEAKIVFSNESSTRIELTDVTKTIKSKINQTYSLDGTPSPNALLDLLREVLWSYLNSTGNRPFHVPRIEKYGGPMNFNSFEDVLQAFSSKQEGKGLVSADLKPAVVNLVEEFLNALRDKVTTNMRLFAQAYPKDPRSGPKDKDTKGTAEKSKGAGKEAKKEATTENVGEVSVTALDIRVGKIVEVAKHSNADSLYVEQIDLGESKPRTVVSGLVKYVPIERMKDRLVLVCCNLSPANMRGVNSEGMVLAAQTKDKSKVDLVDIPNGAKVGERVQFEGETGDPDTPTIGKNRLQKVLQYLETDSSGVAKWKGKPFTTSAGVCTSHIKDAVIA